MAASTPTEENAVPSPVQQHDIDDEPNINANLNSLTINTPLKKVGIIYGKESQPPEGSKEEADLIILITSKQEDPYKEINTSLKDPESLENNLSLLSQHLSHTKATWKSV